MAFVQLTPRLEKPTSARTSLEVSDAITACQCGRVSAVSIQNYSICQQVNPEDMRKNSSNKTFSLLRRSAS